MRSHPRVHVNTDAVAENKGSLVGLVFVFFTDLKSAVNLSFWIKNQTFVLIRPHRQTGWKSFQWMVIS